ncbi:phage integrase [Proteus mirabilis]|uniref:phage integrase n=1 Tax=Proteus mirabilis TaxID=584 RepID=UPI00073AFFDF|nr:tyrosine-type recombinase/integrase [Proteus mirabilis]EJD6537089.1 tyrosine-type recombinase/integrase [Proteus mirabilis]ELI8898665.1 tyrosine-type recombinase/integrase [Proteus mirabilis]KSX97217.1 integrase [Proteus mirabilis]MBC6386202.1 integrase [Proteus mirabilis]MBG2748319.1 tyrosine-type recombinase/integrase [Proteus mirabilis]
MAINKQPDGRWQVELYPNGRTGRRIRKLFVTKGEAVAYERHILEQAVDKPWLGEKQDRRKLTELIDTWYRAHGVTLGDGEKRRSLMMFACDAMGDPLATEFTAKMFSSYREKRLSGEITRTNRLKTVTPRTVNLELAYFRAMFNELIRLDEWMLEHPLAKVRSYKTDEQEMAFLTNDEIRLLLEECERSTSTDLIHVVKICLATGARWSEAENLTATQIRNNTITFTKTKGKRNRSIPVSHELIAELPKGRGSKRLFTSCYSAFRSALKRTGIELPERQSSHVLRHTFASHFMMSGGNILVLQRILGHTDIKMTMRYSHFAPDHLNDALIYNPLSRLNIGDKSATENHNHH